MLVIYVFPFVQDKIGSWYSHPVTGRADSETARGGIGKYLKGKNAEGESAAVDSSLTATAVAKKRKLGVSTREFEDFSSW